MSDKNILQKYKCPSCEEQFITNEAVSKAKVLKCPYCQLDAEAIAESNGEDAEEIEDLLGCLMVRPSEKESVSSEINEST